MGKFKELFGSARIIILVSAIVLALVVVWPNPLADGVAIRSVAKDSAASLAGILSPEPSTMPMNREVIEAINNRPVESVEQYYSMIEQFDVNNTFTLRTSKNTYRLTVQPDYRVEVLPDTVTALENVTKFNESDNSTYMVEELVTRNETRQVFLGREDIGLSVYPAPTSNIRQGLDLQGGTRVILKPEGQVSAEDLDLAVASIKQRLNVYGLSDIIVRPVSDSPIPGQGQQFISVEVAGVDKDEVRELVSQQGKFEATIANQTVFRGGEDITYVCRTSTCAGIDPNAGCQQTGEGWTCSFRFSISISTEAAQRQAALTSGLEVDGQYLSQDLELYLDNELVDTLRIGADLKGNPVTDISISGPGTGQTQGEAFDDALANMKQLQTVLITGSLPVELSIVKTDSISPILGKEFAQNVMLVGLLAILAVAAVVSTRYRRVGIAVPMVITMLSEVVIVLGLAALIKWNLDLAAIAGIIIAVGSGVDDQIVITDETLGRSKREEKSLTSWAARLKNAFFIIMAAYFTLVVAMIPLWFAGAGLLKGFALTTILGVTVGVFVTRPAFAKIVEVFLKD